MNEADATLPQLPGFDGNLIRRTFDPYEGAGISFTPGNPPVNLSELHTPTIARGMPINLNAGVASRIRTLLKRRKAHLLPTEPAKCLAHLVALSWLTEGTL